DRAIGSEITEALGGPPGTAIVPLGNGALLGGVAEGLGRSARVVAVVAKDAPVMADSLEAGVVVESARSATIADGLAVRVAIPYALGRIRPLVREVVRVSDRELARAIGAFAGAGIRGEASAAGPLAALDPLDAPAEPIVLVVTGPTLAHAPF